MIGLKCIWDVEKDEEILNRYKSIYTELVKKYGHAEYPTFRQDELFEEYQCKPQYARTIYTGKLKEGIELTELELSMILDGGFSHFGGSSDIRSDRTFKIEICTD